MCYNMCMKNYDVIVIGGGPAGASAALYCARSGFSVCVIDGGASALLKAERIDNYYGTGGATGAAGAETLDGQVTFVSADGGFNVTSTAGELYGKKLIVATGASRARPKSIDDGAGISYCAVCDAFFYRKKRVGVIGAGAYARHEYETLAAVAASVALFTDGDTPSFEAEETYTQKITGVKRDGEKLVGVALSDGKCVELDGLFVAVGVAGATAPAKRRIHARLLSLGYARSVCGKARHTRGEKARGGAFRRRKTGYARIRSIYVVGHAYPALRRRGNVRRRDVARHRARHSRYVQRQIFLGA